MPCLCCWTRRSRQAAVSTNDLTNIVQPVEDIEVVVQDNVADNAVSRVGVRWRDEMVDVCPIVASFSSSSTESEIKLQHAIQEEFRNNSSPMNETIQQLRSDPSIHILQMLGEHIRNDVREEFINRVKMDKYILRSIFTVCDLTPLTLQLSDVVVICNFLVILYQTISFTGKQISESASPFGGFISTAAQLLLDSIESGREVNEESIVFCKLLCVVADNEPEIIAAMRDVSIISELTHLYVTCKALDSQEHILTAIISLSNASLTNVPLNNELLRVLILTLSSSHAGCIKKAAEYFLTVIHQLPPDRRHVGLSALISRDLHSYAASSLYNLTTNLISHDKDRNGLKSHKTSPGSMPITTLVSLIEELLSNDIVSNSSMQNINSLISNLMRAASISCQWMYTSLDMATEDDFNALQALLGLTGKMAMISEQNNSIHTSLITSLQSTKDLKATPMEGRKKILTLLLTCFDIQGDKTPLIKSEININEDRTHVECSSPMSDVLPYPSGYLTE